MPKAPGKAFLSGLSIIEIMDMFPDNQAVEAWFVKNRWPDGVVHCPECGSTNVQTDTPSKTQPYRCRERQCRLRFSAKTGTVMHGSNLPYPTWAIAVYLNLTNLKGVSSIILHRDLKITQKSAWHLAMRLRKALEDDGVNLPFHGPVEADETYIGGLEKNKHYDRKLKAGRGGVGRAIVAGVKDRETNKVVAKVVPDTKAVTLQGFVEGHTEPTAQVYTDDGGGYEGIDRAHESVKHSVGEYVREMAHTNGMESFWATIERAHKGVFHKFSKKHLDRYVTELPGKHNSRNADTEDQVEGLVAGMVGKRLSYRDLIADNGLPSGARL